MNQVIIRPYQSTDQDAILAIIKLNTPHYFAENEAEELKQYLNHELEDYFVIEKDDKVVGAGGINYPLNENFAVISWDLIHPDFQKIKLGNQLLNFRMNLIKQKGYTRIRVRTSQMTYRFYEKSGFSLTEIIPNYWSKGYDLYDMFLVISENPIRD